ncbi:MAG: GIY-YIG nuclease family protein [Flavobacteriaceae bacterium]|nr:GIY-YIG nuclease family protein [Flavobacteriaceae bacterium]
MYTIIDVETTGQTNRITEISIFKYNGTTVIDEFTSLVNPEDFIPPHITALTGIDNAMVANAPYFSDIAKEVLRITEETIFVAHNVNFDYNVIHGEFKRLNIDFRRKKLCTVRLSRKLIPGFRSYSLGKLCANLGIKIEGRHRARGDAEATVILFQMLLTQENSETIFTEFLNKNSKEATLPAHLPKEVFEALPNAPGVYYFRNKKGKIIYVGKAKDIKKRVLSHFYNKKQKELDLCRETGHIDFELSGSELIALLMEDAAIKNNYPQYNVVSKRSPRSFAIFSYTDRTGIVHLAFNTVKGAPNPHLILYSQQQCRLVLEQICSKFELCPKFCHLQENVASCSHYAIETCKGVCCSKEDPVTYNERVALAITHIRASNQNLILKEKGRNMNEDAFILVRNGIYLGYGFIDRDTDLSNVDELENYLIPQKDSVDVWRILQNKMVG